MAVCSPSIVLPFRLPSSAVAMRPLTALYLAAGCVVHAAAVALFGEKPPAPRRLLLLLAERARLVSAVQAIDEATQDMTYAEASCIIDDQINPLEDRIDHLDAEVLRLPPQDLAEAMLKVRLLADLHRRYGGVLPEAAMADFVASFEDGRAGR